MKRIAKFALTQFLIVSTALLVPISSAAQTNDGSRSLAGVELETPLKKGDRAPFEGVLTPYPQFYYYNDSVEKLFELETEYQGCMECDRKATLSAVGGASLALVLCMLLGCNL